MSMGTGADGGAAGRPRQHSAGARDWAPAHRVAGWRLERCDHRATGLLARSDGGEGGQDAALTRRVIVRSLGRTAPMPTPTRAGATHPAGRASARAIRALCSATRASCSYVRMRAARARVAGLDQMRAHAQQSERITINFPAAGAPCFPAPNPPASVDLLGIPLSLIHISEPTRRTPI